MSSMFTVLFLMSLIQRTSPDGQQIVSGQTGRNVTLTFQIPTGTTSFWLRRIDEKCTSYCQDERPTHLSDQKESFRGRVEGVDSNRINGTVSLTLRNLTRNDNGTYEFQGVDRDGKLFNETVFLIVADPDWQIFSGHTGRHVTMTFQVPTDTSSFWLKRIDEKYVFYCRDGNPMHPSDQEESFKGRVEGVDCNSSNGTVSVTVRNLTRNDNGTYKFEWADEKRFNETVYLIVADPGQQIVSGQTGRNVTLTFQIPTGTTSFWLRRIDEKCTSYCQDERPTHLSDQKESFRGRVEGVDSNRINGTVSLTLRNLTRNDNGTYEFQGVDRDGKLFNETVFLIVADPVNHLLHILPWVGAAVCGVIGLIYKGRCMKPKSISCVSDPRFVKVGLDGDDENTSVFDPEKKNPFNEE